MPKHHKQQSGKYEGLRQRSPPIEGFGFFNQGVEAFGYNRTRGQQRPKDNRFKLY